MMPAARINERGYRRYEGARQSGGRWWVVARQLVRSARRQKAVIALAVLTAFPTVVTAVLLYIFGRLKPVKAGEYVYYLSLITSVPALLMAMRAGGGAIADDARAGGFQFYFSRPITHAQYLAGKLVGVTILIAVVSALPEIVLALVNLALASSGASILDGIGVLLRAALLGLLASATLACVVVALSSLIRRRALVQAALAGVIFLPWVVGTIFREFTRTFWPTLPSIPTHLGSVAQWLFAMPNEIGDRAMPPAISVIALAAIGAGAVWLAWQQLRKAEVVAA